MNVQLVAFENYMTGKTIYKELTREQHEEILMRVASSGKPIQTRIIREREL